MMAFFAALGASSVYAGNPDRDRIIRRYDERGVYQDSRGEYHWQVIEREVWIPERRVGTVLGTRVIPGHYEVRQQRIKVYHNTGRYNNERYYDRGKQYQKGKNGHPHGMPPGQRKKQDGRYNDRDRDYDRRDREYESRRSIPDQILEEIRRRRY